MKRIIFCFLVIAGIVTCPLLENRGESKSPCGIYMKVSGRVIEKETGKGIKGVEITINNKIDSSDLTAYSDQDGNYEIKMVPPDIYEILVVPIHRTCPYPLVLEKIPEDFTVSVGRNIKRLNLYLIKGGSISGRVFGPDGVTPFCDGKIKVVNALIGKTIELNLSDEGKFRFDGLHSLEDDKFNFVILVSPNGYANVAKAFKVKLGEEINDFNFIVGLGDNEVKGNVVSAVDNRPIKGAEIHIISQDRHIDKTSDAFIKTDELGNFYIRGFKNTGTIEISIFHDDFQWIEVIKDLRKGINTFDFKLSPKKDKKIPDFFLKEMSPSTAAGSVTREGCLCPERSLSACPLFLNIEI
ncbi:MAG TPA: carboxypeptidase regulatory-like domain-containing protein, partial [Candidatus Kapabacteria bacterium]|nr:carboxypeptidase regulatory-like domain-containing protein [Candidatus Kapabacteria bacterium]